MGNRKTTVPVTDLEKLEHATAIARSVITEARQVQKDLRATMHELADAVSKASADAYERQIVLQLRDATRVINEYVDKARKEAVALFNDTAKSLQQTMELSIVAAGLSAEKKLSDIAPTADAIITILRNAGNTASETLARPNVQAELGIKFRQEIERRVDGPQ